MEKILIIDDSALSRRVIRGILESTGYTVIEASDGIAGIEQYFLEKPDLVFLDMNMEGMHGVEVLKKLRVLDKNARVVVATADIQTATRDEVLAEGASGFINKPFSAEHVIDSVKRILSGDVERRRCL